MDLSILPDPRALPQTPEVLPQGGFEVRHRVEVQGSRWAPRSPARVKCRRIQPEEAATGMRHHDDHLGAESLLGNHEGTQHVVCYARPRIAQDVRLSGAETQQWQRIDTRVHACDNGEALARRRFEVGQGASGRITLVGRQKSVEKHGCRGTQHAKIPPFAPPTGPRKRAVDRQVCCCPRVTALPIWNAKPVHQVLQISCGFAVGSSCGRSYPGGWEGRSRLPRASPRQRLASGEPAVRLGGDTVPRWHSFRPAIPPPKARKGRSWSQMRLEWRTGSSAITAGAGRHALPRSHVGRIPTSRGTGVLCARRDLRQARILLRCCARSASFARCPSARAPKSPRSRHCKLRLSPCSAGSEHTDVGFCQRGEYSWWHAQVFGRCSRLPPPRWLVASWAQEVHGANRSRQED